MKTSCLHYRNTFFQLIHAGISKPFLEEIHFWFITQAAGGLTVKKDIQSRSRICTLQKISPGK